MNGGEFGHNVNERYLLVASQVITKTHQPSHCVVYENLAKSRPPVRILFPNREKSVILYEPTSSRALGLTSFRASMQPLAYEAEPHVSNRLDSFHFFIDPEYLG